MIFSPGRGLMLFFSCVLAACAGHRGEVTHRELLDDSRRVAHEVKQKLSDALARLLDSGNILRSFSVCRYDAIQILSDVSRASGMQVSRVSLKPRNPGTGAADAWEQRVLREFEWRMLAGEQVQDIDHGEVVDEPSGWVYRYMVAVPVHGPCMQCHGPDATLTAAVRAQLAADYPKRADTAFMPGAIGGAISIRRARQSP